MGARDERAGGRWYPSFSGTTRGRGDGRARPKRRAPGGATVGRRVAPLSCSQSSQRRRSESKSRIRGEYLERAAARQEERKSGEALDTARKLHARTQHRHTAIRRGEEDTNEARKRRDKRDREIEARVGDWPRDRERQTESETESERALFPPPPRSLLLRIDSTRASSVRASPQHRRHDRDDDRRARAHLRAESLTSPGSPRRPRCRCSGGWTPGKMR